MYQFHSLGQSPMYCFPAYTCLWAEALSNTFPLRCNMDHSNGSFTQQLEGGKKGPTGININYLHNPAPRRGISYHPNFNILLFKKSLTEKDNKELWVLTRQNSK